MVQLVVKQVLLLRVKAPVQVWHCSVPPLGVLQDMQLGIVQLVVVQVLLARL